MKRTIDKDLEVANSIMQKTPPTNATDLTRAPGEKFRIPGAEAERRSTKMKKEHMLMGLEASLGIVTQAAKLAHIDRSQHYRWLEKDARYVKKVRDIEEMTLDFAETYLHQRVKAGDTNAITFLLRTKGKKRGYIERSEVTGPDGGPIETKRQVMIIGGKEIAFT